MSITRKHVGKRLSQVVVHNGVIYMAGIVADDPVPDDAGAQARNILLKIDGYLKECGSDKSKILSATIWLPNIADYDAVNKEWDPWVSEGNAPARACVESKLAHPKYKVEIRVTAAVS